MRHGIYDNYIANGSATIPAYLDKRQKERNEEHIPPVNYFWKFKQCPRCGGDIERCYNTVFDVETCLQCGYDIINLGNEREIIYGLGYYPSPSNYE